ncbi:hypothetical protein, partial [Haliea atlantica]
WVKIRCKSGGLVGQFWMQINTMSALEKVAWYFFLALTFQRTVPCFIPLKKFAWRCQRVPVVARQKGE